MVACNADVLSVVAVVSPQAEMESNRDKTIKIPLPDGREVQAPMGATSVVDNTTNITYTVRWGQDEAGKLVVMDVVPQQQVQMAPINPQLVRVRVRLPDNGWDLDVSAGESLVLDARSGARYELLWGQDSGGKPVVVNVARARV
jgi:hypothetical protein